MSDLIVISFDDEHTAFEMRAALAKMQKEHLRACLAFAADRERKPVSAAES